MHTGTETSASRWLQARRQVQELAEIVLGDAADYFLYRGKLYGEGVPGQHVSVLMGNVEGCEAVRSFVERLDAGGAVAAYIVDDRGHEPDGPGLPVLSLVVGHLSHLWSNGRRETV